MEAGEIEPSHVLSPINFFVWTLSGVKVQSYTNLRRHPKAFGIPFNLLTGTPSSVPCPHTDACRGKGAPSMCDYSLHYVASRPAKIEDKLVVTEFDNSFTRGFAAVGEPHVAVCLLPGTEIAFEENVEYEPSFGIGILPTKKISQRLARFRQTNLGNVAMHHDALEFPDGQVILLTRLCEGQHATVLQLPAAPRTAEEAREQKRVSVVV